MLKVVPPVLQSKFNRYGTGTDLKVKITKNGSKASACWSVWIKVPTIVILTALKFQTISLRISSFEEPTLITSICLR